jgi:hypothetical protein
MSQAGCSFGVNCQWRVKKGLNIGVFCTPDWNRTNNLRLRRPLPYPRNATLQITLGDKDIVKTRIPIDFERKQLTRGILNFESFVLSSAGELKFNITVGDESITTYTIKVIAPDPRESIDR